jgi:hypothetical protein
MPGAWVREPCLHRWYLGGASQPNRPRQAVAGSERGQSQPPRRAVRSTHEPVFWRHCHCRGTESRWRLTWLLRTQVCASLFSRSSALGPMLLPSAWVLLPFFVRSARPARRRSLVVAAARAPLRDHLRVHSIQDLHYEYLLRASLASCRRLAQWYDTRVLTRESRGSSPACS